MDLPVTMRVGADIRLTKAADLDCPIEIGAMQREALTSKKMGGSTNFGALGQINGGANTQFLSLRKSLAYTAEHLNNHKDFIKWVRKPGCCCTAKAMRQRS